MPHDHAAGPGETGTTQQNAPSPAAEPAAATPEGWSRDEGSDLLSRLDVPAELHEQILGKEAPAKPETVKPPGEAKATDHEEEQEQEPGSEEEGDEQEPAEGDEQPDAPKSKTAFDDPKVQKRMARFNRRLAEKEDELAALKARNDELERGGQQPAAQAAAVPSMAALANVQSERDLNTVVARSQSLLEWCDANSDGTTAGEGDGARFIEPTEVARMRRDAERVLLNAPEKRQQIRDFSSARQSWDAQANSHFPQLFDKESEEHAAAVQLVNAAPWIATMPEANFVLGIWSLGQKAFQEMQKSNGNGSRQAALENPDLPPALQPEARRLRAQAPLAPITPRPPSSGAPAPGRSKRTSDAMQALAADPDGGASSIAAAMAAMSADDRNGAGRSRQPVPA